MSSGLSRHHDQRYDLAIMVGVDILWTITTFFIAIIIVAGTL